MNYGKAIRICRAAFGLTQADLAARLRIGPSQLSLIESGKRRPSEETLEDLCRAFHIPRSLLTLLASSPAELEREDEEVVQRLARNLLDLLAEASVQAELPLRKKDS